MSFSLLQTLPLVEILIRLAAWLKSPHSAFEACPDGYKKIYQESFPKICQESWQNTCREGDAGQKEIAKT